MYVGIPMYVHVSKFSKFNLGIPRTGEHFSFFSTFRRIHAQQPDDRRVPDCPGIRSRTPSDPSGPGGGHPSHPQDPAAPPLTTASRRHLERPRPAGRLRVTTTCHHRPTQPVTVPPGCVCRAGRGQGFRDEPFRGCPRPPRAIWG